MPEDTIQYRVGRLETKVDDIANNHLSHLKADLNEVKISQVEIKTDMTWVKKFVLGAMLSGLGAFIVGVFNLISK